MYEVMHIDTLLNYNQNWYKVMIDWVCQFRCIAADHSGTKILGFVQKYECFANSFLDWIDSNKTLIFNNLKKTIFDNPLEIKFTKKLMRSLSH